MKRFFILAASIGLLAACSGLEQPEQDLFLDIDGDLVEKVIFEVLPVKDGDAPETKASAVPNGGAVGFVWEATDTVGIYPDKGSQVYFNIEDGVGTNSVSFNGGGWALKQNFTYTSYYPFVGDIYLKRDKIPVSFAGQKQVGTTSPFVGARYYLATGASTSEHGVLRFSYNTLNTIINVNATLPAGTYTKASLTIEEPLFVEEGSYSLDDRVIVGTKFTNTLEIELEDVVLTEEATIPIYIMSAPVDLKGKEVTVMVISSDGKEYKCVKTPSRAYQAGTRYGLTCDMRWVTLSEEVLGTTYWGADLNKVLDNKFYFKKLRVDTSVSSTLSWICMTFCSDIHPGFAAFWSQYRKTDVEYCYTGMNDNIGLNIDEDHPSFHLYGTEVSDHIIEFDFTSLAADTYIYSYQMNVVLSGVQVLPCDPPVVEDGTIIISYQVEDSSSPTDILYDGLDVITGMSVDDGEIVSPETTFSFDRSGMHKIAWYLADKTKTKNVSFSGCQAVAAAYFSDSITEFSDDSARKGLLEGCPNLKKIHFPSQLTRIGVADFRDNPGLEGSIVLPDSVTWLDSYAFGHTNISSFTFGKGITTLGMCMFEDCPNLTDIYSYATTCPTHVEDWSDYPFFSHDSWHTGTLHYPQGSDYSQWLSTSPYWLGYFGWTGVDDL